MNNFQLDEIQLKVNNALKALAIANMELLKALRAIQERNRIIDEHLSKQNVVKWPTKSKHKLRVIK